MQQEDQTQTPETNENEASQGAAQTPEERIAELEAQLAEQQAAVLYVKAEGENIRRRATEDIEKARKYALEKFSRQSLPFRNKPMNSMYTLSPFVAINASVAIPPAV